jgi:hypothetical protein
MSQADEVPFLSAMEREPVHETTIKVGRDLWSIDGMSHRALGMTHRVLEALGVVQSRALSMADQGPKDYAESDFERGMKAGAKYGGGYNEAPKNDGDSSSWQKWMMALCGALAVIGIGGVVGMYGKLSAVAANQESQQKQLDNLTQMVVNLTRRNQ